MFESGKVVDSFKGPRELSDLKEFMKRHIKEEPKPVSAKAVQPPKVALNPSGEVLALTGETFSKTLSKGPGFVKFFAPWCGHCKKLAPTWKQLARHMQNKLTVAEVNCDDHSALCKSQGIQGYPTLVWFGQGEDGPGRSEYNGGRKLDQLKSFAEKASAAYASFFVSFSANNDEYFAAVFKS
jgi:thioredoxin domain-containing protein 5